MSTKKTTPTPTTIAAPIEKEMNDAGSTQSFWLFKTGTASKIGKQSQGGIAYQILSDVDRNNLSVIITGNDGGGYFSRERVPFAKIKECLSHCVPGKPFPSKVLRDAFNGRSSKSTRGFPRGGAAMGALRRAAMTVCWRAQR